MIEEAPAAVRRTVAGGLSFRREGGSRSGVARVGWFQRAWSVIRFGQVRRLH
jgi:hypothetical protein